MTVLRAFRFKVDPKHQTQTRGPLQQFVHLVQLASRQLLKRVWTESWLDAVARSKKKAYKVINEAQVSLRLANQAVYFPSRIRSPVRENLQFEKFNRRKRDRDHGCN